MDAEIRLKPGLLTAMTWNIHGGLGPDGRHDLARILALVRRADPDILALQEVESRRLRGGEHPLALFKRALGHHGIAAAAITTPDGDYGQVLLSRWAMSETEIHDISVPGREPRGPSPPSLTPPVANSSWSPPIFAWRSASGVASAGRWPSFRINRGLRP
jgi:endonuclease/exonuclease/phosphatase family metal-dependent hydrolase